MAKQPDRHNFLNWKLAFTWECPVQAEVVRNSGLLERLFDSERPFREWVRLRDGKFVEASFGKGQVRLRFNKHSDRREVRDWLRHAPEPYLGKLELSATADGRLKGRLGMVRTALPAKLERAPSILVEEDLLDGLSLEELQKQCGVPGEHGETVLIVRTAVRLRTEDETPRGEATIFFHHGAKLTCRIEGAGEEQFLLATSFDRGDRKDRTLQNVRFIGSPTPRFVTSEDDVEGIPLNVLTPVTNDHLRAWMDYEHAERRSKEAVLERRRKHPLEYGEILGEPSKGKRGTIYRISLMNAEEALDEWVEDGRRRSDDTWSVGAALSLYDLDQPNRREINATLKKIRKENEGRVVGLMEMESSETPPAKGKLVAKEHGGDKAQHDRRDRAIEKLRNGNTANPDLLRYLLFPDTIPPIDSEDRTYWRRPDGPTLNEQQRRAVIRAAREPGMLLIQGPPGTGKTTVIAEIIHQLRRRHRNEQTDGRGPLRVLVSSIQNDAVDNAAEKLSDQDVFVDLFASHDEDETSHQIATEIRSRKIARRLYDELRENHPGFARYERLCKLRELVRELRPHLTTPDTTTVATIDHVVGAEAAQRELTSGLRDELCRLRDSLQQRLDDLEEAEADGPEPDPAVGLEADLRGALEAIVDETSVLTLENLDRRIQRIEALDRLMDRRADETGSRLEELRIALTAMGRLRRAARRGRIGDRAQKTWDEIRRASSQALAVSGETPPEDGEDVLSEWGRGARDWLHRVNEHLDAMFEQHATSEAAIRFDWVRALNDRPMTMPEVIRSYAPVTATTCQKSDRFSDTNYDVAIIDEAGRGGLDVLIPMTMGRSVILIGDQNQLPPHVERELERELEEDLRRQVDLSTTSLFSFLWEALDGTISTNCVSLNRQFRMHRDIGTLVSRSFYEPEVKLEHACEGGPTAERAPRFGLCNDEPFVWVDTSDRLQSGDFPGWPFKEENPWEADLVIKLLSRLEDDILERLATRTESRRPIGLIPFYSDQKRLLQRELARKLPGIQEYVELGTADSFQGKEFPLVILSTVRSNANGKVGFLALPNRLNVGISRAQSQVILFGDSACLIHPGRGSDPFKSIWNDVTDPGQPGKVVPSLKI